MHWQLLVLSLPTENATARMRAWRALKACGAAVLRDGVYALPDGELQQCHAGGDRGRCARTRRHRASAARRSAGRRLRAAVRPPRRVRCAAGRNRRVAATARRQGAGKRRCATRGACARPSTNWSRSTSSPAKRSVRPRLPCRPLRPPSRSAQSPDEPRAVASGAVPRLDRADYRGRVWATRRRPWVDRLASAWLIRRFIDPEARFLWLKSPADCPKKAIGFDFDGAAFSHVGARVTFENLARRLRSGNTGLAPPRRAGARPGRRRRAAARGSGHRARAGRHARGDRRR